MAHFWRQNSIKFSISFSLSHLNYLSTKSGGSVYATVPQYGEVRDTQPRRSVLSREERMRRGSGWPLAQSYDSRPRHPLLVFRFALVCVHSFPASLTSLLDGHASLCLPWNAIQTAKQPGIETTCPYRGAGSNYSENRAWNSLSS